MKLLINTATTFKGGGVQVANSFINECKNFIEHEYHVILGDKLQQKIKKVDFPDNFHFYKAPFRPATKVFSFAAADAFHKKIEAIVRPEVIFTTSGPAYWKAKAPHLIGYNLAHYLYPKSAFYTMIPFSKKLKWKLKGQIIRYFFQRDADACVVQTNDINERLAKWLDHKKEVHTVTNTCSAYYFEPKHFENKLPPRQVGEFRLLTLSSYYLHKNIGIIKSILAEASYTLKEQIRFVLTLSEPTFKSLFSERERQYIYNVGPVPMIECAALYQECDAMFLPTLLECFSASYPEAMVMEKPILTSNLGFARTVCADAALYFDPMAPEEIIKKINLLYHDVELRKKLIDKGLKRLPAFDNPKIRAQKYLEICKSLVKQEQTLPKEVF